MPFSTSLASAICAPISARRTPRLDDGQAGVGEAFDQLDLD